MNGAEIVQVVNLIVALIGSVMAFLLLWKQLALQQEVKSVKDNINGMQDKLLRSVSEASELRGRAEVVAGNGGPPAKENA